MQAGESGQHQTARVDVRPCKPGAWSEFTTASVKSPGPKACSHLGLALCELQGFGEAGTIKGKGAAEEDLADLADLQKPRECGASTSSASAQAAALLAGLRGDVPIPATRGRGRHRMLPLWGGAHEKMEVAPFLFIAVPPWPGASSQRSSRTPALQVSCALAALGRTADALSLQLAGEDEKRLHILALPTAALILLQLASAMAAMMIQGDCCRPLI